MTASQFKGAFAVAAFVVGALACKTAGAGGISLYEVGTADVGLASAGYSARAQDASTVFTNPAGITRLAGDQFTLGAQVLYAAMPAAIRLDGCPAAAFFIRTAFRRT
jgi:long-subunit fatty acid transport protein